MKGAKAHQGLEEEELHTLNRDNTFCRQNGEFFNIEESGGTYSHHSS